MSLSTRFATTSLLLALLALNGCGQPGKPKTASVSGTVTFDGQPLTEGTVYFKTVATGSLDALAVKDGKFEGAAEVGDRRVEVNAFKTKVVGTGEMKGEVKENLVHPRYNIDSTLTATVTEAGPNTFKFEVKSK